jgi:hypothetical protein
MIQLAVNGIKCQATSYLLARVKASKTTTSIPLCRPGSSTSRHNAATARPDRSRGRSRFFRRFQSDR